MAGVPRRYAHFFGPNTPNATPDPGQMLVVLYVSALGIVTVLSLTHWNYFLMEIGILLAIWGKVRRERLSTVLVSRI